MAAGDRVETARRRQIGILEPAVEHLVNCRVQTMRASTALAK